MGCCKDSLLSQLKELVSQIDDGGCCKKRCSQPLCSPPPCSQPPCWPTPTSPFAQVCMTCPPPCLAPTVPKTVKPLQLPCSQSNDNQPTKRDHEEDLRTRYSNFYNNYNIDWHKQEEEDYTPPARPLTKDGQTIAGKNPHCEDYSVKKQQKPKTVEGCPTGFKPCTMKLTPPPGCDPCGVWHAQVQACPPKSKKSVSNFYTPGKCKRPCCKHWKPKEGPCLYDDPCKAHCFNHPPGMKPSGRYS